MSSDSQKFFLRIEEKYIDFNHSRPYDSIKEVSRMAVNIAALLKERRKARGLSVKDVQAFLLKQGISVSDKTIYGWESGHRQPDADTFLLLCRYYGIDTFDAFPRQSNSQKLPDNLIPIRMGKPLPLIGGITLLH